MLPFPKFVQLCKIYWKLLLYCKSTTNAFLVYAVSFFNLSNYVVIFFSGHLLLGILKFPGQRPGVLLVLYIKHSCQNGQLIDVLSRQATEVDKFGISSGETSLCPRGRFKFFFG